MIKFSKSPLFYLGIAGLLVIIFLCFTGTAYFEKKVDFSLRGDIADGTQYLSAEQGLALRIFDLNIIESSLLAPSAPPFLVQGRVLGVLGGFEPKKEIEEYLVKEGDFLSTIASRFDISLETLLWANDLSLNSMISPGQKLIILPVSGILHVVKEGDALSGVAQIYGAEADEVVSFNALANQGDIFIGDLLIIPGGQMPRILPQLAEIPLAESYFIFPCEGKITQGPHGPFDSAVDIGNDCGSPVVAAAGGIVQRAGPIWVGGNSVTILHLNGVVTYYGHLSQILVQPNQKVTTGNIIGRIGNTGYTLGVTGCHLHFEVRGARNFLSKYPVGSYLKWTK